VDLFRTACSICPSTRRMAFSSTASLPIWWTRKWAWPRAFRNSCSSRLTGCSWNIRR